METPQQPVNPDRPFPAVPGDVPAPRPAPGGPPPPGAGGPPPPGTSVVPRNRRLRLVLAIVAGFAALLCLGGVGVFITLYEDATAIDRGSPEVAANNYLSALLIRRDAAGAQLSVCDGAQLTGTQDLLDEIVRREQALNTGFSINIENIVVDRTSETSAQVEAGVRRSAQIDGIRQSTVDVVRLTVEDRDGWRVCAATRVP